MTDQLGAMLVVERGMPDTSVIPLDRPACLLGKSPSADIVIDNPYVSRRHTQIVLRGDSFEIEDLGSKNGTFVNGVRLQSGGLKLNSGDRIELARERVVLRFQESGTTATLPPMPQAGGDDLVVNSRSREVSVQRSPLEPPLSRKEFDVLNLLYERRGEACSKGEIASTGWPEREAGDVADQDIEQYIRRIRLRLEPDPSHPQYILTVRGYGYKLANPLPRPDLFIRCSTFFQLTFR